MASKTAHTILYLMTSIELGKSLSGDFIYRSNKHSIFHNVNFIPVFSRAFSYCYTINKPFFSSVIIFPLSTPFTFCRKYVLQLGPMLDKPGDIGNMNWQLTLCLLLSWIIVFFCLMKGVKSSGKVWRTTALTLARKRCFATFAGVGGGGWCDPPLAFPNEAS